MVIAAIVLAVPIATQVAIGVAGYYLLLRPRTAAPSKLLPSALNRVLPDTAVVYPVIVYDEADVHTVLGSVRQARLMSGAGYATHLMLVDFADSDTPIQERDAILRAALDDGIAALNAERATPAVAMLCRRRRWSAGQGVYLGWERKRGKLTEIAELIAGAEDTTFDLDTPAARDIATRLRGVRYLLTLDVGNRLQPKAAQRLVATIAHPDNTPVVDPVTGIVVRGYGFVRPTHVPALPRTLFGWALYPYPVPDGVPPQTQAAYGQDMFLGQGVIHVATYREVLAGRIPPDRVLSHDKLEGAYGRTAALGDARVVEAPVDDYLLFRGREHRWIRGDTHLLPWVLMPGRRTRRSLPVIDRWEMARDFLGHLYPVSLVALLVLGWLAAPVGQVGWWMLAVAVLWAHPIVVRGASPVVTMARAIWSRRHRPDRRARLVPAVREARRLVAYLVGIESGRLLVWLPLLLDHALVTIDAVGRAVFRMTVSRRNILEWTSAAKAGRIDAGLGVRIRLLWPSCVAALLLGVAVTVVDPIRLAWAAPLLTLWLIAPWWAYRSSCAERWMPQTKRY